MFNPPNVKNAKQIVYDVETNGVDWKKNYTIGHVITLGPSQEDSFYFPTRHGGGGNLDHDQVVNWIKKEIASRDDIKIIGHNLKFDLHMSRNDGIEFKSRDLECTMINSAIIDENARSYSLEYQALNNKVEAKKGEDMYKHLASLFGGEPTKKQMENFWRTSGQDPMVVAYAIGDGVSTWQLREKQQEIVKFEELERIHRLECQVLRTLFRMERNGIKVDENQLHKFRVFMLNEIDKCSQALPKDFNPRSPKQMQELMRKNGITNFEKTEKGNITFNEKWLKQHEIGRKVVSYRKTTHLINSFVTPLIDKHLYKGRVHTNFNQMKADEYGVVSGRLSSSLPNMQQVPKRDKVYAPLFRSCFVPDDGQIWSSNDYSQQEYVMFACYTKPPKIYEGYLADPPIDIHQSVAEMFSVERDPTAKRLNLGKLYGMGVPSLADSLEVNIETARELSRIYDLMVPEAKRFMKSAEKKAKIRGFVKSIMGRRRRFPDIRFAHKAGNQIIQMSCADVTKQKMVEVDNYFEDKCNDECSLLLQIHDDLNWTHPDTEEGRMMDSEARRIMSSFGEHDVVDLPLPMRVDNGSGKNWGTASFKIGDIKIG